ncbi:HNH endonuclease signature motif containing protein [Nocardioides solisilvae]|uniref:HNH endonuclease signature motif containing protein n=1 Tax=Nocardioides solisilvae TaxID=1542435 RepID=UPI000D74C3DC|nr:HNH endonuclease signature motif containing protein [Nocardioides solisilvae]
MSSSQSAVTDTPGAPRVAGSSVPSRVGVLVEAGRDAVRSAGAIELAGVPTGELGSVLQAVAELESAAAALRLALSAEAEARRVAEDPDHGGAATGTDAWLAGLLGSTRESQAAGLRLAGLLKTKYAAVRQAYAAGRLRADQVRVIVNAAEQAPDRATPDQLRAAEELMVAKATGQATRSGRPMNAKRLRQAARRMFDPIDHDLADDHEHKMLTREKHGADQETFLALHDNGDGTWTGRFRIPELHGNLLAGVLGHLTSPRRLGIKRAADGTRLQHPDGTDQTTVDESAPTSQSYLITHGQALCELIEHLPATGLAPSQATILVTMSLGHLMSGLGTAKLDTGITITTGEARRLACNAGIVPAVLGTRSEPLDLGRLARLHTMAQRRALALLYDTCAIEGCERPFAWTEIHHPHPWGEGGHTSLDNALPLCGHHHRKAHDPGWQLRHDLDGHHRLHRRRRRHR